MQANIFARDLLMPAVVLAKTNITTASEISNICKVSNQSAEIRADRLAELIQRNKFGMSPLERQVHKQFDNYIKSFK